MSATVKVSRDGTVTKDGTVIGRVEKVIPNGLTFDGYTISASGAPQWFAYDADGNALTEYGKSRKCDAVTRVEKESRPLVVEGMKLEECWPASMSCITAYVSWGGYAAGVSRYPAEDYWVVDSFYTPDSIVPIFSNGVGTRVTRAHTLQGEQAAAATAKAVELGLLPG